MPAFQPYRGKPAVRNDREDRGNVGIIRNPVRASILPDRSTSALSCRAQTSARAPAKRRQGECTGQPLNRERPIIPGADTVPNVEGHTHGRAICERPDDPAWSQTLACADASCTGTGRSHARPAALSASGAKSLRQFVSGKIVNFIMTFQEIPCRRADLGTHTAAKDNHQWTT
jgi:hypothetical protein